MVPGVYELVFEVAAYFREAGVALEDPPFLDRIPLVWPVECKPALSRRWCPFAYSTYRGS